MLSRSLIAFFVLLLANLMLSGARAQSIAQAEQGDPPLVTLITISPPDERGVVTVSGGPGAVSPNARVAVRNLYTEQTVYVQAGITGTFRAELYGPGNTPFLISPVSGVLPTNLQNVPGALPGGPATIYYGPFPETRAQTAPVTQIALDGDLSDWQAYPDNAFLGGRVYALRNQESLYVGARDLPAGMIQLALIFTLDGNTYELLLAPRTEQFATLQQVAPFNRDLGMIRVAKAVNGNTIELRLEVDDVRDNVQSLTLNELRPLADENVIQENIQVNETLPTLEEIDGIARPNSRVGSDPVRFTIGGATAGGAGIWSARGRTSSLSLGEEPISLELDVTFNAAQLPDEALDLNMIGTISLQPVVIDNGDGTGVVPGLQSANGYSTLMTPSGLAIITNGSEIPLAESVTPAWQILQDGNTLTFGMTFELTLPDNVPPGMYVPIFRGYTDIDGAVSKWESSSVPVENSTVSRHPLTRLPIVLNVGGVTQGRLLWTLFHDHPSEGSRGIMAREDQAAAALSNRVGYDSPTYILPPSNGERGRPTGYPLEPYLLNQMPNAYETTAAPQIPFLFPGGRLNVTVTRPDGEVDNLGSAPIVQNQLSTSTMDERERFGASSPIDVYRLTTLNPVFSEYPFTEYGNYTITMSGMIEDVWGNRYDGGGTYEVTIAEPLDIMTGVLPGTPFEVGDAFNPVVHISPAVPAQVTITLRVYPLDGGPVRENVLTGLANRFGYFHSIEEVLRFDTPGEYTIDYEVRYTDSNLRLWAASQRSAGVIANPDSTLIAHGERGLAGVESELEQAWYNARHVADILGLSSRTPLRPNLPYFSGDVAWIADGALGGLMPAFTVQDSLADYESWLLGRLPNGIEKQVVEDALPVAMLSGADFPYGAALAPEIANEAYTYFSAVRPSVAVQQFVSGGSDTTLPTWLDTEDRLNGQIGAGIQGLAPGDYVFLFGGTVVRNEAANILDTAIYGSVAVVIPADDARGARVFPPFRGEAGGSDGGALLTVDGTAMEMFFYPSGVQPGDVLIEGDVLSVAGHVAPALPSTVRVTITAPDGTTRQFEGNANAVGYFYEPSQDFIVDEPGLWTIDIETQHSGLTSAGQVEPPLPTGGVPGARDGRFTVYVVPQNARRIALDRTDMTFPASSRYNFTFPVPTDWTNREVFYTLAMPGYVIEQGTLQITGTSFTYPYDPAAINRRFPNFEVVSRTTGPAISDPLTLTVTITGTDEGGRFQSSSRKVTLFHDRLISIED